ncbi:DUF3841 domain-containing protein [Cohnella rhizosphaerae]|uniref:DUF3841 domain-containing protein n=1 Tax=Cohnella rhizosphaerae TaxID=1457232 RepID=A0A9X4QR01_9BACL|nr:DUF3841 domain-containing protein [Cohnella rhizosphaerae]MDG0808075.1 DUF3841 domain-containing protein [Cohnella rhizosphaerae]
MTFWTIQSLEAWDQAVTSGYLVGNPKYIDKDWLVSYRWMMNEMKKRLIYYKGEFPIWLWTKRPDLMIGGRLGKGQQGVLIEAELNKDEVLISDFMAWHIVLNNDYLTLSEEEDNKLANGTFLITKEQSWIRIFEYHEIKQYDYWKGEDILQAVTGRIELSRLKKIKEFTSR